MFFLKQKTAYEMRISDWSSDVCSSDLVAHVEVRLLFRYADTRATILLRRGDAATATGGGQDEAASGRHRDHGFGLHAPPGSGSPGRQRDGRLHRRRSRRRGGQSSEERRVGNECVSTCRSRGSPAHSKKKNTTHNR